MSRSRHHARGRGCIVCRYTPAHNLRDEAGRAVENDNEAVEDYLNNVVIARDGTSRLDYAYRDGDWCPLGCRCDDCLESIESIAESSRELRVGFLELAKVA